MRQFSALQTSVFAVAAATVLTGSSFAQCPADDSFEDNDSCVAAVVIPAGSTSGLIVHGTAHVTGLDNDFWVIQNVAAGDVLTVDVLFSHALGDVDTTLYDDAACTVYLDGSASVTDNENVSATNSSGVAKDYYLNVRAFGSSFNCNTYSLQITVGPDPCQNPLADDSLEENDDCSNAVAMVDGLSTGLFVSKTDADFYEVSVADLDTLFVDLTFTHGTADVDVYIYDDPIACGDLTSYLVRGFSSTDNENISWTNSTGSTETYYVQVVVYASSSGDCNNYDMALTGTGGSFATAFCLGDGSSVACPCANESVLGAGEGCKSSLGFGAILTASGSASVAADDIAFTITQGRANQPSMLVQGATLISVPFKDGVLCMGNPTERVEVVFLDGSGSGTTASSIVTNGNVVAGNTRHYQQWFRDPGGVSPCGTGSNFSNGLTVIYN